MRSERPRAILFAPREPQQRERDPQPRQGGPDGGGDLPQLPRQFRGGEQRQQRIETRVQPRHQRLRRFIGFAVEAAQREGGGAKQQRPAREAPVLQGMARVRGDQQARDGHHGQQCERGAARRRPAPALLQSRKDRDRQRPEAELHAIQGALGREARELGMPAVEPPAERPQQRQFGECGFVCRQPRAGEVQLARAEGARQREHQRADERTVEHGRRGGLVGEAGQESDSRGALQERAERAGELPILAHAEPQQPGALDARHRRGRLLVERQRDRHGREDHPEGRESLGEEAETGMARSVDAPRERQVQRAERERGKREPVLDAGNHACVQAERDDGQAEHQ